MKYARFDDAARQFAITDPLPPRPWINYLSNRRLSAFVSHHAGGLLWYREPQSRRITRYHYTAAPPDRPGFYLYVRDRRTGALWNPHYAPTCTPLDRYECRHEPGVTSFTAASGDIVVEVAYFIPPDADVMLWYVTLGNAGDEEIAADLVSYLEFGLLEFLRETIGWCYVKNQIGFTYDPAGRCIRYDYHCFEAPFTPRIVFGCSAEVAGFDCSRDAFIGRTGTYGRPEALAGAGGLTGSELALGGHGAAVLGTRLHLEPGDRRDVVYGLAVADTWEQADALLAQHASPASAATALTRTREWWAARLDALHADTGDPVADRFINTWTPYNALLTSQMCRTLSTDHMGLDGLRFRDTSQDALAVAHLDVAYATDRMRLVLAQQTADGGGCYAFWPDNPQPTTDHTHRSDNTVWPVYTCHALVAETGDASLLEEVIPYRDGGEASVYEHLLAGLRHIHERRGPAGLPLLFDVDWNDSMVMFGDPKAQSVMLGMQMIYACEQMRELAALVGRDADAAWCTQAADQYAEACNAEGPWDGAWYARLLLSDGRIRGSARNAQGQIYLNPQAWSVISGAGERDGRGRIAMDAAAERLDSDGGLAILDPPFVGFPEPEDPPLGSNPGIGENGGIFCHANTWAVIAECLLGRPERAWKYYRQLLPQVATERFGEDHYAREPYVYLSSLVGPKSDRFGEGGISWLTGTASWMYVAATQYLLGVRPTLAGLRIRPCLPRSLSRVRVTRRYRGTRHEIEIDNACRDRCEVTADGRSCRDGLVPVGAGRTCRVAVRC